MNAEQLKQQALDELKQEQTGNQETPASETIETPPIEILTEVIAEVISLDKLRLMLSENNKVNLQIECGKLLAEGKFAEVQTLISTAQQQVMVNISNLPKYYLFTDSQSKLTYMVEIPKVVPTVKTTSTGSTGSTGTKYPSPFNLTDKIQLKHGEVVSQIYTITQAGLVGTDNEVIKASKAVRNFIVNQLGKAENPTGYAGTSHGYWIKVS